MVCKHFFPILLIALSFYWWFPLLNKSFLVGYNTTCLYLLLFPVLWCYIPKPLPIPMSRDFYPMFYSRSLMASSLTFVFNPFKVNYYVWHKIRFYFHSFACGWPILNITIKSSLFLLRLISGRESGWRSIGVSYGDNEKREGDDSQV